MKHALLALFLCLSLAARGDDARTSFNSGQADAMRVSVNKLDGAHATVVRADQVFHQGDALRITLEGNFPGFVYILNQTAGGETRVLLPSPTMPNTAIEAHQPEDFPAAPAQLAFDDNKGVEVLRVVMARQRVQAYDEAAAHGGVLPGPDPYSSGTGRTLLAHSGVVTTLAAPDKVTHRNLYISTPGDASTYVAVTGKNPHLGSGDVGVFEIHLKHE